MSRFKILRTQIFSGRSESLSHDKLIFSLLLGIRSSVVLITRLCLLQLESCTTVLMSTLDLGCITCRILVRCARNLIKTTPYQLMCSFLRHTLEDFLQPAGQPSLISSPDSIGKVYL